MQRADYLGIFDRENDRFIEEWKEFLRFPSISKDPAYHAGCVRCVEWLRRALEEIGLQSEVLATSGKPVVFGVRQGEPGLPVVLYYGHYDVQPADPLEEWTTPPFEPTLRNGRLYARGALDNKGQTAAVLKGIEAIVRQKALKCTLKVLIEGEEESGSGGLFESLAQPAWRERLKADVLMVSDTEAFAAGVPGITMGLRGIIHLSVKLCGPRFDLHSGLHGGSAPNPALGMARLLATLHNPDGSIAVKGFCDSVMPPDEETRRLLMAAPFDEQKYEADFGVKPLGGEQRYPVQERLAFRPTIEINGLHSGYGGPGPKTIIPSKAEAKITSRLAAGQDPAHSLALIEQHLRAHTPPGCTLVIDEKDGSHGALLVDPHTALVRRAGAVLKTVCGRDPVYQWCPASIPVVVSLLEASGAEPLLVGFGLPEDRMHGPDESFLLTQYRDCFLYTCMMLEELSRE